MGRGEQISDHGLTKAVALISWLLSPNGPRASKLRFLYLPLPPLFSLSISRILFCGTASQVHYNNQALPPVSSSSILLLSIHPLLTSAISFCLKFPEAAEMSDHSRMRVLLVQTAYGLTPSSGGYGANISLLRQLRGYGHVTAQICYGFEYEVDEFTQRATLNGVQHNLVTRITHVADSHGDIQEIWIKIFTGHDRVQYIVIDLEAFLRIFPAQELIDQTRDYLEASSIPFHLPHSVEPVS